LIFPFKDNFDPFIRQLKGKKISWFPLFFATFPIFFQNILSHSLHSFLLCMDLLCLSSCLLHSFLPSPFSIFVKCAGFCCTTGNTTCGCVISWQSPCTQSSSNHSTASSESTSQDHSTVKKEKNKNEKAIQLNIFLSLLCFSCHSILGDGFGVGWVSYSLLLNDLNFSVICECLVQSELISLFLFLFLFFFFSPLKYELNDPTPCIFTSVMPA